MSVHSRTLGRGKKGIKHPSQNLCTLWSRRFRSLGVGERAQWSFRSVENNVPTLAMSPLMRKQKIEFCWIRPACEGRTWLSLFHPGRAPSLGRHAFARIERAWAGCIADFPLVQRAIAAHIPSDVVFESGSVGLRCILDVAERYSLGVLLIDHGKSGSRRRRLGRCWRWADYRCRRDVRRCGRARL